MISQNHMRAHIHKISKHVPSIFQGRLDFASGKHGISLSIEHPLESAVLRVLFLALFVLIGGYLYFVSASILDVIARKEALSHIAKIQGSIGGLEQEYFTLSKAISSKSGERLGLAPVSEQVYVYRPGNVGAVTMARDEI